MAQANRLQALLDLSRSLSSSLELREVLREFATRAAELTGATSAELSTYDPAHGDLVMLVEYRGGADEITEKGGQVYHLSEYPATRHVLDTQEPTQIRVDNPADDAAERALLVQQGQKSLLMLPLVARGETIGLMEIVDVRDRVWDDADVEFCRALCDIVAIAIRNATPLRRAAGDCRARQAHRPLQPAALRGAVRGRGGPQPAHAGGPHAPDRRTSTGSSASTTSAATSRATRR